MCKVSCAVGIVVNAAVHLVDGEGHQEEYQDTLIENPVSADGYADPALTIYRSSATTVNAVLTVYWRVRIAHRSRYAFVPQRL